MNIRVRFALLFGGFVAILLLASAISIFILYRNYRTEDFYARMKSEGFETYSQFLDRKKGDTTDFFNNKINTNVLYQESVLILDSARQQLFHQQSSLPDTLNNTILGNAKIRNEYRYQEKQRQFVVLYIPNRKHYVYISAYDRFGIKKLNNIKIILAIVFGSGLALTGLMSFVFVSQAFRPLRKLSMQMQKTTGENLTEKIEERRGDDEIRLIASSFNAMLDRLKRSFDAQKNFVNHASHELRTPLAVMLAQTENALNKNLDIEGYKHTLNELKQDQYEITELTNSLLLLSQYDRLTFSSNWADIRVDEILYESINMAKVAFEGPQVKVEFNNVEEERHLILKGNEALLGSLFRNLIKNAYNYSSDKIVSIKLNATASSIELQFDNTGAVLSGEEAANLFIPFFREHNAISKKGHGLGLAIVSRIVEAHRGHIKYEAIDQKINRFTVTFY